MNEKMIETYSNIIPTILKQHIQSLNTDQDFAIVAYVMEGEDHGRKTTLENIQSTFGFTEKQAYRAINHLQDGGLVEKTHSVEEGEGLGSHYVISEFGKKFFEHNMEKAEETIGIKD